MRGRILRENLLKSNATVHLAAASPSIFINAL